MEGFVVPPHRSVSNFFKIFDKMRVVMDSLIKSVIFNALIEWHVMHFNYPTKSLLISKSILTI